MLVLAGRGSNLAGYTKKSKMNLVRGGQNFASFAKSGDKIVNLATLVCPPSAQVTVGVAAPPERGGGERGEGGNLRINGKLLRSKFREGAGVDKVSLLLYSNYVMP